jgi:hypothetical protein
VARLQPARPGDIEGGLPDVHLVIRVLVGEKSMEIQIDPFRVLCQASEVEIL